MPISALIIDDERLARDELKYLLDLVGNTVAFGGGGSLFGPNQAHVGGAQLFAGNWTHTFSPVLIMQISAG